MRRAVAGFWWSPTAQGVPALAVTAAFFALGGLCGCLLSLNATQGGGEAMAGYLDSFLRAAQAGTLEVPALAELLWRDLRWPIAALFMGFSVLGLLGLPILCFLRGFLLAFSVAAFSRAYAGAGLAVAFLLLGIPALASVPAFFVLAAQSFSLSWALATSRANSSRREPLFEHNYLFRLGLCAVAMGISLLLEYCLVPVVMAGAAGKLLG